MRNDDATRAETFDAIDFAIEQQLDKLPALYRGPYGKKARVTKHLDRILKANRQLGWSYARIADEVLKPAGLLISGNTLRVYVQQILKQLSEQQHEQSQAIAKHESRAMTAEKKETAAARQLKIESDKRQRSQLQKKARDELAAQKAARTQRQEDARIAKEDKRETDRGTGTETITATKRVNTLAVRGQSNSPATDSNDQDRSANKEREPDDAFGSETLRESSRSDHPPAEHAASRRATART